MWWSETTIGLPPTIGKFENGLGEFFADDVEGGKPVGGKPLSEAYNYSGDTYKYYKDSHQRNSIDGRGMKLDSSVHYGEDYNNAFWNGTQMVYGDGDGEIFNRFTKCRDIL
jgi:Zn-dependent metalloprotease